MNKQELMNQLLDQLQHNLQMLINTAKEAKLAATSEESKAENKYDTRGLEASYLAGAQAKRAQELEVSISQLRQLKLRDFNSESVVDITAIVFVEINGEEKKHFFILPCAGGSKVETSGLTISVITPESPLGKLIIGKSVEEILSLKINGKVSEYEILEIH